MSRFICQTNWTDTVHYQSRMTSNGIAITPSLTPTMHARRYSAFKWEWRWVCLVET